ncbi:hypothetical protein D9Q98_002705 [Chlorella vulgaris]|uniref:Secreted protein n=1 Tax=Chlorella vulgaris TaxID=3077 RepID=A0A9D4TUE3_CHLVU|nr:hypothetical protein D9Q98_002705 [Chlorella vulgaris]
MKRVAICVPCLPTRLLGCVTVFTGCEPPFDLRSSGWHRAYGDSHRPTECTSQPTPSAAGAPANLDPSDVFVSNHPALSRPRPGVCLEMR